MKVVERMGIALGAAASTLMVPALAFAEEGGAAGADILIPKKAEFVPALIIFLIIWFLLAKFVWPKVLQTLDARQQHIEESIEQADETRAEAQKTRDEADQLVVDAHRKASEIVLEARKEAEGVRAKIIADARLEAEDILAKARENAALEQRKMYDHATDAIAKTAVAVASKIVDRELSADDDLQRSLIKKYLREVGNLNG